MDLWAMCAIAFLVYYCNYMLAPLIPAFSREFAVLPDALGWLVPGFSIAYGVSTLCYGVLSDRLGRTFVLLILLPFASLTTLMISFATTAPQLVTLRILSGIGSGGIVTIALAAIGDQYSYVVQGRPMGLLFGASAAGMGLGSSLGPILNPVFGWRTEFRTLACGLALIAIVVRLRTGSFRHLKQQRSYSYREIAFEYLSILCSPRGRRTTAFIFSNGGSPMEPMYYIGLDVHKRKISYCVKDSSGRVFAEGLLSATRLDLDLWMKNAATAVECGDGSDHVHGLDLRSSTITCCRPEMKVAHPLMLRAIAAAKKKNDRIDARKICDCLRCDFLPECYMASTAIRERRRTLRYRNLLVRQMVQMKIKISAQTALAQRRLFP